MESVEEAVLVSGLCPQRLLPPDLLVSSEGSKSVLTAKATSLPPSVLHTHLSQLQRVAISTGAGVALTLEGALQPLWYDEETKRFMKNMPETVPPLVDVTFLSARAARMCAVSATGDLILWSTAAYSSGQARPRGEEFTENGKLPPKRPKIESSHRDRGVSATILLPNGADSSAGRAPKFSRVVSGLAHLLAVSDDGRVWAWGSNQYGQSGLLEDRAALMRREALERARGAADELAAPGVDNDVVGHGGRLTAKSLTHDATLSPLTVVEDEETERSRRAQRIAGEALPEARLRLLRSLPPSKRVAQVSCGWSHSLVCMEDGALFSFGWGLYGQLGHGELKSEYVPRMLDHFALSHRVVHTACGVWHSVAVTDEGLCFTWGYGKNGQLGHGDNQGHTCPEAVEGLRAVKIASAVCGSRHTVALAGDGSVYAWGYNKFGALGLGHTGETLCPQRVPLGGKARACYAGQWASVYLLDGRAS